jgi:hypothetical protein
VQNSEGRRKKLSEQQTESQQNSNNRFAITQLVNAFVTFKIAPENLSEVFRHLLELKANPPEGIVINKIVPVAGRLDCILDVTAASTDDHFLFITEDLSKIKGIESCESLIGNEYWLNYLQRTRRGNISSPPMAAQMQAQQQFPWVQAHAQSAPQPLPRGSRARRYRESSP